jgi:protein TonB
MFEKLVESAKQKQGKRARRLFLFTGVIYATVLTALGVLTIIGYNPALAEEYLSLTILTPPTEISTGQPSPQRQKINLVSEPRFRPPSSVAPPPDPHTVPPLEPRQPVVLANGPRMQGSGRPDAIPGSNLRDSSPPPPPPPTPTPVVKPAEPPAKDQVVRLTSVLTQGRTVRKIQPPYPAIARQARVQGSVQVQIDISETGEVTNAALITGHPLLRDAALQAARQWTFRPTELNGRPVRAIGIITFNFTLN